jgi:SAM-dependent methyltransferase
MLSEKIISSLKKVFSFNFDPLVEKSLQAKWEQAQNGESNWWKGVSQTGYNGQNPSEFIEIGQKKSMLDALSFLGHPEDFWKDKTVVEFGSGPAGIVEYIQAKEKIAIEPLFPEYLKMFPHLKNSTVRYLSSPAEEEQGICDSSADLSICYNMLDHVYNPKEVMQQIARVTKQNGLFLFQVNVYRSQEDILQKSGLHAELHPYSFTPESALEIIREHGFSVLNQHLSDSPNECKEYYFICGCVKK